MPDSAAESTLAQTILGFHRNRLTGISKGFCTQCREAWPCVPCKLAIVVLDLTEPPIEDGHEAPPVEGDNNG